MLLKRLKKKLGYTENLRHRTGGSVRKILTKDVGLSDAEAERLMGLRR